MLPIFENYNNHKDNQNLFQKYILNGDIYLSPYIRTFNKSTWF